MRSEKHNSGVAIPNKIFCAISAQLNNNFFEEVGKMKSISVIIWVVVIGLCLSNSQTAIAACPSADLTGDCKVTLADFVMFASQWLSEGVPGPDGIGFVIIPAGTFQMGDPFSEDGDDERPVHTVTLDSFKMSRYPITNGQYCEYLNSAKNTGYIMVHEDVVYATGDSNHSAPYFDLHGEDEDSQIDYSNGIFTVAMKGGRNMIHDPVIEVSWYGAKAFCDYYGLRLPTEAEWEYAARGGLSGRRFPWGYSINHSHANYKANGDGYPYDSSPYTEFTYHPDWNDGILPYTSVVGSFAPNGYGLYDMIGNVFQWCSDWYSDSYYDVSPSHNPPGPTTGDSRVRRGSSWNRNASYCRIAHRTYMGLDGRNDYLGFRVCLDIE